MNSRHCVLWVVSFLLALSESSILAEPHIAIQPYGAVIDDVTGETKTYGQLIVHRAFDVQLEDTIKQVPIFSIQYPGLHFKEGMGNMPNHAEARAKCIAERLAAAWSLLDHGGELIISHDDWEEWHLPGAAAPEYASAPDAYPAIYVRSDSVLAEPLRIMTIYPEDEESYPWITNTQELAKYIVSLIRSHYLLFWKMEADIHQYEQLEIDHAREGKIFKEVAIRALEMAELLGLEQFNEEILKDALARIALPQRERLYRMATTAPNDWE
jgi:hypothetical protein